MLKYAAKTVCIPIVGVFVVNCRLAFVNLVGSAAMLNQATRLEYKVDGENGHALCALLSCETSVLEREFGAFNTAQTGYFNCKPSI